MMIQNMKAKINKDKAEFPLMKGGRVPSHLRVIKINKGTSIRPVFNSLTGMIVLISAIAS